MSPRYLLSLYRRIGPYWAARITSLRPIRSLRQIRDQIVAAIDQALQDVVGSGPRLVPIPVRASTGQRRSQRRSHD